ncbi:hypothetical protein [Synechococcus sp. M16CYN]|uniref:hypothetical protein n=1 Tax=Synechococcus sp. M16CYN TaxID=3103139 RepID=UPI0032448323
MSKIKPKQIILHCGLHKTGSTYLQENLKSNYSVLLDQGIMYLGPNTIKKQCKELWRYLQCGKNSQEPRQELCKQTLNILIQHARKKPYNIHTILISFEAIFGTLRAGLVKINARRIYNNENQLGLYRYSKRRVKRLMNGLEFTLSTKDIHWVILFATRQHDEFVRSCYIQLIKEGYEIPSITIEQFKQISNFSYADPNELTKNLNPLKELRKVDIRSFSYDDNINKSHPSTYLNNFIKLALPNHAEAIQSILRNQRRFANLNRNINPSLNNRGLEIATQARPIFTKYEWKLFRKFLEKNFSNNN